MNQTTAKRDGPEPLRTLASYRRQRGRVYFGMLLGLQTPEPAGNCDPQ